MTSAAAALYFSFHLYMTLYRIMMSQIVFRLVVSSDLWELHCPCLETNMGLALLFPFHSIHFIAEDMLMTNNYWILSHILQFSLEEISGGHLVLTVLLWVTCYCVSPPSWKKKTPPCLQSKSTPISFKLLPFVLPLQALVKRVCLPYNSLYGLKSHNKMSSEPSALQVECNYLAQFSRLLEAVGSK